MRRRRAASGVELYRRAIIFAVGALCCSACAASPAGRFVDSAADSLIQSGDAFAHGAAVREENGRLTVKSFTVTNRRRGDKELRNLERVGSIGAGTDVDIAYADAESEERFRRIAQRSGETLEYYRRRIFGPDSTVLHADIIIAPPAAFGRYRHKSTVTGNAAVLRFLFKADKLSVVGDDAFSWFAPLETVMHETYHVQTALDRIARSGPGSSSHGSLTGIMEEAAAKLVGGCAGLHAFGKTTLARNVNVNLNDGERQGTLTDKQLRALLSDDFRAKEDQAYYLGLMLFNTIWAEFVGAEGYLARDDRGADQLLRMCSQDSIGRPELLTPLIRKMADDGVDAPEFPESFGPAPESWLNFGSFPDRDSTVAAR